MKEKARQEILSLSSDMTHTHMRRERERERETWRETERERAHFSVIKHIVLTTMNKSFMKIPVM